MFQVSSEHDSCDKGLADVLVVRNIVEARLDRKFHDYSATSSVW